VSTPEQAERWIDEWADSLARKAERYQSVQAQVEQVRLSATSQDGAVRVTVGANGVPTDLELSDRTRSMPTGELAALILTTMRRAQTGIADRVAQIMQDTVGQDTGTIARVVDEYRRQFPEQTGPAEQAESRPERRQGTERDDGDFGDQSIFR
jgi:DNA-binding protein YbaB